MRYGKLLGVVGLLLVGMVDLRADDRVLTAVLLASNAEHPKALPGPLGQACGRLQRVLNYNQFEILGSATQVMDEQVENWMVPTDHFWLRVKSNRAPEQRYRLSVELFHDKRPLVETDAVLGVGSPLFIRGPLHARGQVLVVLLVVKGD
jgi:hypothetical protein